jgi:hypothetical protein
VIGKLAQLFEQVHVLVLVLAPLFAIIEWLFCLDAVKNILQWSGSQERCAMHKVRPKTRDHDTRERTKSSAMQNDRV